MQSGRLTNGVIETVHFFRFLIDRTPFPWKKLHDLGKWAKVLAITALVAVGSDATNGSGITAHLMIGDHALNHIDDPGLKSLLVQYQKMHYGSGLLFPDSIGFSPPINLGNVSHHAEFLNNYLAVILDRYPSGIATDPDGERLLSHFFGSLGHVVADLRFDKYFVTQVHDECNFYSIPGCGCAGAGGTWVPNRLDDTTCSQSLTDQYMDLALSLEVSQATWDRISLSFVLGGNVPVTHCEMPCGLCLPVPQAKCCKPQGKCCYPEAKCCKEERVCCSPGAKCCAPKYNCLISGGVCNPADGILACGFDICIQTGWSSCTGQCTIGVAGGCPSGRSCRFIGEVCTISDCEYFQGDCGFLGTCRWTGAYSSCSGQCTPFDGTCPSDRVCLPTGVSCEEDCEILADCDAGGLCNPVGEFTSCSGQCTPPDLFPHLCPADRICLPVLAEEFVCSNDGSSCTTDNDCGGLLCPAALGSLGCDPFTGFCDFGFACTGENFINCRSTGCDIVQAMLNTWRNDSDPAVREKMAVLQMQQIKASVSAHHQLAGAALRNPGFTLDFVTTVQDLANDSDTRCAWALDNVYTHKGGINDSGRTVAGFINKTWEILQSGGVPVFKDGANKTLEIWVSGQVVHGVDPVPFDCPIPACGSDANWDGSVDLDDYSVLESCLVGPDGGLGTDCECFDLDTDTNLDLKDFAAFQVEFQGS